MLDIAVYVFKLNHVFKYNYFSIKMLVFDNTKTDQKLENSCRFV